MYCHGDAVFSQYYFVKPTRYECRLNQKLRNTEEKSINKIKANEQKKKKIRMNIGIVEEEEVE